MINKYGQVDFEKAIFKASDNGLDILDYGDANMFRANIFQIQKVLAEKLKIFPLSTEIVAVWGHWHSKKKGWSALPAEDSIIDVFKQFMRAYQEDPKLIITK